VKEGDKSYQIMELVATGGTAVLYRAVQTSLDRVVAVKKLHHHLTTDENFTRRFILEAKAAASLDHENIVKIIDFGVEDGTYMMVMEFIEGESLREILDKWKQLPVNLAFALVHQICMGLEHAHAKGIVHRDIKPGNIMVTRSGRAKITDFGLAKLAQGQTQQTAANSILGTPLYMSPEQAFGESVDQRSDLFSLGTVLYECLTGHQPFTGENYMGVIQNIIHQNAPHPSKFGVELPAACEGIVLKSMHKNRETRFQSAREFRLAIEKFLGLDALREANENLKTLLSTDGATVVLPRTERVRKQRRRLKKSIVVAITVASLSGIAALGYFFAPNTLRDRISGLIGSSGPAVVAETPATAQESSAPAEGIDGPSASGDRLSASGDRAPALDDEQPAHRDLFAAGLTGGFGTVLPDSAPARRDNTMGSAAAGVPVTNPEEPVAPPKSASTQGQVTTPSDKRQTARETPDSEEAPATPARRAEESAPRAAESARHGWLSITSEPPAEVYIDGLYTGDTPLPRLEISGGRHALECRSPKYESYQETVTITAGEFSSRDIVLQKLTGRLSLSTIDGAEVYLDGVLIGVTPLPGPVELDAGRHQLTVKKAGYHVWNNAISIDAKQIMPLKITLSPIY
jgi:serine/threonine protein kinase